MSECVREFVSVFVNVKGSAKGEDIEFLHQFLCWC